MGLCMRPQSRVRSGAEVLVLGPAGAGKTLLLRRLRELGSPPQDLKMATIPTVGVELLTLDNKCNTVVLREVGSCLSSRWSLFFKTATALLFLVDGFDEANATAAHESLVTVLNDSHMSELPVCLVFTKKDLDPEGIYLNAIVSTVRPAEFAQGQLQKITTMEGNMLDCELASRVKEWLESL